MPAVVPSQNNKAFPNLILMGMHDIPKYLKKGETKRVKVVLGSSSVKFEAPAKFYLRAADKNQARVELQAIIGDALNVYPSNVRIEPLSPEGGGYSAKVYVSLH